MKCKQIRHWIEAADFRLDESIMAHVDECDLCRAWFEQERLLAALRQDPVPPPSRGFEDRVIEHAIHQSRVIPTPRGNGLLGLTAAVSLAATALIAWLVVQAPHEQNTTGEVVEPQIVNVVIDAKGYRRDALLRLEFSEHVQLEGFGDRRQIEWRTNLEKGRNLLALPVRIRQGTSGHVRVALSYDGALATAMHIPVGT